MIPIRFLLPAAMAIALTVVAGIAMVRGEESAPGGIKIVAAWARATPPGATVAAAYVTLRNSGGEEDRLIGVESAAAAEVEVHQTIEEEGIAKMRPLEQVSIPSGEDLDMQPGGIHLMLMGLAAPLKEGMSVPLSLTFEKAGEVAVDAKIARLGANAPPPM